ncbi:hypothetical protein ACRRTK_012867 [Alexandromys fortis]
MAAGKEKCLTDQLGAVCGSHQCWSLFLSSTSAWDQRPVFLDRSKEQEHKQKPSSCPI